MHRWLSHALSGCIQKSDRNVTPFLKFLEERRRVKKHTALMLKLKGDEEAAQLVSYSNPLQGIWWHRQ